MLVPINVFPSQAEFVWRHELGTTIEMQNEAQIVTRFNDMRLKFKAWPIAPIPGTVTPFARPWLLLVENPSRGEILFPSLTDRFTIDMVSTMKQGPGSFSLVHLPSSRIPNPYEDMPEFKDTPVQKAAAFKVDVPRS